MEPTSPAGSSTTRTGKDPAILDWAQAAVVNEAGAEVTGAPADPAHPVVFSAVELTRLLSDRGRRRRTAIRPGAARSSGTPGCGRSSAIEEDWWGFGGAWGAGGGLKGQIGPLGPSPWKQSSDPDPDATVLESPQGSGS